MPSDLATTWRCSWSQPLLRQTPPKSKKTVVIVVILPPHSSIGLPRPNPALVQPALRLGGPGHLRDHELVGRRGGQRDRDMQQLVAAKQTERDGIAGISLGQARFQALLAHSKAVERQQLVAGGDSRGVGRAVGEHM